MAKSVQADHNTKRRHSKARERLLDAAGRLFYEHGVQAVGVNWISVEANAGKMTLYRHFPSKDDLVVAYLERRDAWWRGYFTRALDGAGRSSRERLTYLFERLEDWFESEDFLIVRSSTPTRNASTGRRGP